MSLFEKLNESKDNTTKRDILILDMIKELIAEVKGITEISESELKAISLIETDKYLKDLLEFYDLNKKHVKRKYSKEIIEIFKEVAKIMQFSSLASNPTTEGGL